MARLRRLSVVIRAENGPMMSNLYEAVRVYAAACNEVGGDGRPELSEMSCRPLAFFDHRPGLIEDEDGFWFCFWRHHVLSHARQT